MKKTYQVELKYTSYVMYEIEANSKEDAENKAWDRLENDSDYRGHYGEWDINLIEEVE